ncbi:MAG TPA: hypothetical protein VFF52_26135 [Isosphaeraceae bacterium]|nr:hypothetical protein [Isosphaeraceae bacterium]
MDITQEFLVLPCEGGVRVYGVHDFPSGTWVGRDAQKLHVVGPVWVRPPRPELTAAQWEKWQDILREAGFSVTVGPFWTSTPSGRYHLLEDVRDELLRSAR